MQGQAAAPCSRSGCQVLPNTGPCPIPWHLPTEEIPPGWYALFDCCEDHLLLGEGSTPALRGSTSPAGAGWAAAQGWRQDGSQQDGGKSFPTDATCPKLRQPASSIKMPAAGAGARAADSAPQPWHGRKTHLGWGWRVQARALGACMCRAQPGTARRSRPTCDL